MITHQYTELTALLANAMPRPWSAEINGPFSRVTPMYGECTLCNLDEQDAKLIVASVNALPSLLADLEAAQKREQVLREALTLAAESLREPEHNFTSQDAFAALAATEAK
jgi:hypothetical protein